MILIGIYIINCFSIPCYFTNLMTCNVLTNLTKEQLEYIESIPSQSNCSINEVC
jgi:hypothetical protein